MSGWVLPDSVLRDAPVYAPRPFELADLELLLSGAYTPLTGFHRPRRAGQPAPGAAGSPTARPGRYRSRWRYPSDRRRADWTPPTRCAGYSS